MEEKTKISVRNLVEFLFRSGNIDNRRTAPMEAEAMQEGSRLHRKLQKRMGSEYTAEVPLSMEVPVGKRILVLEGRADGIITKKDKVTIDEIKCVYRNVNFITEPALVHKAQVLCYAYMYLIKMDLKAITIQVTYCQMETEQQKKFREDYDRKTLKKWFLDMMAEYRKWLDFEEKSLQKVMESVRKVEFPYAYRKGQHELVVSAYRAMARHCNLYIQAPTGVGKTLSAVFPAVKAVGEGKGRKIFYLTAKTITRTVAQEAFDILRSNGLYFPTITITAKEKMCVMEEMECNPVYCHRAKGHFDRINEAIYDCITHEEAITREVVTIYADRYDVCPYEFCLDLSNWMEAVICDYNYAFDPRVHLKRYFGEEISGNYLLLVDEAHNLVDRAREMYSATLYKEDFLSIKKIFADKSIKIVNALEKCNKILLEYKRECENYVTCEEMDDFILPLMRLISYMEKYLEDNEEFEERKEVLDFYFQICRFSEVYEALDDSYVTYQEMTEDGKFMVKLFCIHPAHNLQKYLEKAVSTLFFSATMLPVNYYKDLFTGDLSEYAIYVESPFDAKKRALLLANDITSKYTRRNRKEYEKIGKYLKEITAPRPGNYMVFFPSYQFMEDVFQVCVEEGILSEEEIVLQGTNMSELEREEFLKCFSQSENGDETASVSSNLIGFCVMGGIFSEGIDLTGESLIGTIIVGNGFPGISTQRQIIREYFDARGEDGFAYAYRYPGMNKVMQAAGRVIRTDRDTGVIALLEERFLNAEYQRIFPKEWANYQKVNLQNVGETVSAFWEKEK